MRHSTAFAIPGLIGALLCGFVLACGDTPLDPQTGLDIHVRRGPVSTNPDSTTVPVDSAGIVFFDLSGNPLGQTFTDTVGEARVVYAAGSYHLQMSSCPGAPKVPDAVNVVVVSGGFSLVNFVCDTGS